MNNGSRLLVPIDATDISRRVLPLADALARALDAQLLLFSVVPDPALVAPVTEQLERTAEDLSANVSALPVTRASDAASAIAEAAADQQAELVVMATHRWSAVDRWLNGSVAEQVLRLSREPLILIGPDSSLPAFTRPALRVLVALDGSTLAERALGAVSELGSRLTLALRLVRAVDDAKEEPVASAYLEDVAKRLRTDRQLVEATTVVGSPANAID
ncbi:MAG: universal stress protein, partial [Chloroflexi bacterium]|nr:universal stress protein [Chloroflexota bacterium]